MPRRNKSIPHQRYITTSVCQSKQRFATEEAIQDRIADREFETPQIKLGYYHCLECSGWHLTQIKPGKRPSS